MRIDIESDGDFCTVWLIILCLVTLLIVLAVRGGTCGS